MTGILDEDNMVSDSPVNLSTQQSIKAYADTVGTGGIATHAALTATHGIASTIAGLTETQTFTNKTLTNPIINTILTATGKTGMI